MDDKYSARAYIKSQSISGVTSATLTEVAKQVLPCMDVEVTKIYKFSNLDSLVIPMGLSCKLTGKKEVKEDRFIYIMSLWKDGNKTNIVKIGVSMDVEERRLQLMDSWDEIGVTFQIEKISKDVVSNTLDVESAIHTFASAAGLKYKAKHIFSGYTELFISAPILYDMIDLL